MRITLTLEVEEPEDIDTSRMSGLTQEAEDRLFEVLPDHGFAIVQGPSITIDQGDLP